MVTIGLRIQTNSGITDTERVNGTGTGESDTIASEQSGGGIDLTGAMAEMSISGTGMLDCDNTIQFANGKTSDTSRVKRNRDNESDTLSSEQSGGVSISQDVLEGYSKTDKSGDEATKTKRVKRMHGRDSDVDSERSGGVALEEKDQVSMSTTQGKFDSSDAMSKANILQIPSASRMMAMQSALLLKLSLEAELVSPLQRMICPTLALWPPNEPSSIASPTTALWSIPSISTAQASPMIPTLFPSFTPSMLIRLLTHIPGSSLLPASKRSLSSNIPTKAPVSSRMAT